MALIVKKYGLLNIMFGHAALMWIDFALCAFGFLITWQSSPQADAGVWTFFETTGRAKVRLWWLKIKMESRRVHLADEERACAAGASMWPRVERSGTRGSDNKKLMAAPLGGAAEGSVSSEFLSPAMRA